VHADAGVRDGVEATRPRRDRLRTSGDRFVLVLDDRRRLGQTGLGVALLLEGDPARAEELAAELVRFTSALRK